MVAMLALALGLAWMWVWAIILLIVAGLVGAKLAGSRASRRLDDSDR